MTDREAKHIMENECYSCRKRREVLPCLGATFCEKCSVKNCIEALQEREEIHNAIPHICEFCIGCEIEPPDGHGCDKHDNFVLSIHRLVKTLRGGVKKDLEG